MLLGALAGATREIELGTCVLQVPLRHPVELAHRVQSLNLMSEGRLRLGLGAGSTAADFEAVEADFDKRFETLTASLEVMRRSWRGEAVFGPELALWPGTEAGPPVLLGAWRSRRWIDLAARDCQGWIASGIHTSLADLESGIRMFREAGGERVIVANIFTDLRAEPERSGMIESAKINLICAPFEARERLRRLVDLGVDDALLVCPFADPDQLARVRDLYES